jgi:peptide/nickel transport system permease protein
VRTGLVGALARRVATMLLTLFGVSIVVFLILRILPGDAVTASLGVSAGLLTPQQRAALDAYYGVGLPPLQQYGSWLGSLLVGNLGVSLSARVSVASLIGQALPATLELSFVSLCLALAIGVPLGALGAVRQGGTADRAGDFVSLVGLGVPVFIIGTVTVTILASVFHYFPSSLGYADLFRDPWLNIQQIIIPALVLSLSIAAALHRTTRASVLEVSGLNFVRTARGNGLSPRAVTWRHIVLNALIPIVTMAGIQLGYLLGGTVIIEQIFVLPGLGRLLLVAINNQDFSVVMTVTMLYAAAFLIVNMLVDVLYTVIDPRTRAR